MIRLTNRQQDSPKRLETYYLRILNGCRKEQLIPIPSTAELVVGRSRRCDLRITNAAVSRMHCRLRLSECGGFYVDDMNSVTGTFVNERPVVGPTTLNVGDVLRIGPVKARVVLGAPATESDLYSIEPRGRALKRPAYTLHGTERSSDLADYSHPMPMETQTGEAEKSIPGS